MVFPMEMPRRTLMERTRSQSKLNATDEYRFSFMKVLSKYFDSEWGVSKIKVDEKLKSVGFDVKNHRLIIMTFDRVLYYVDIPAQSQRYLERADIRVY